MLTIYALTNMLTGQAYIGSTSNNPAKRFREHRCALRHEVHQCGPLQKAWIKYEEPAFVMRTLAMHPVNLSALSKRKIELSYMHDYLDSGLLYNELLIAYQPPHGASKLAALARVASGYRPSAESNEKRRLAQLGVPKGHGAKISATKRRRRDEIVCSMLKIEGIEVSDKEPKR